ncbi:MAG: hypothetical protein ACRD2C_04810 [Acidimicrobiales bacterium]
MTDRGVGMIGSVAGLMVTVLLLALAAQVLLGLYATSTLRATLHDAASRAANQQTSTSAGLDRLADEAEASLGRMGERTSITLSLEDTDGDGIADVVAGDAVAAPPRIVPPSVGGMVGFEEIHAGVRVRIERVR